MGLKYLYGQDAFVADWVARSKLASGFPEWIDGFADRKLRAIGIIDGNDQMIAGLVYFNWHPEAGTIEMSIDALPKRRWLTPETLRVMFQYPFLRCGCQMMSTRTSERSRHVNRMLEAMNFDLIRIPRAGGRNEDGVYAYLTYEKWLESKFCKRFGHHVLDAAVQKVA